MANLTITATSVVPASDVTTEVRPAGVAVTAGQVVYLESATDTYKLADADATGELLVPRGIALTGASIGQPLTIARAGNVTIGATLTKGVAYVASATAGAIAPAADLTTGAYMTVLGVPVSTTVLKVAIVPTGIAI